MKKVFGLIMMLFMFVGITIATPTATANGQMVIDQTEFVLPQTVATSIDVLDVINDWVGDNFSSEGVPDALMPNTLDYSTIDNERGLLWLYGDIPFDIVFEFKPTENTLNIILYNKDKPITTADKQKASAVIDKFTTDFTEWLDKMPQ